MANNSIRNKLNEIIIINEKIKNMWQMQQYIY